MTATESASAMRRDVSPKSANLANGGPFLGEFVEDPAVAQGEGRADRERPEPADEHEQDEDHLGRGRQPDR